MGAVKNIVFFNSPFDIAAERVFPENTDCLPIAFGRRRDKNGTDCGNLSVSFLPELAFLRQPCMQMSIICQDAAAWKGVENVR